MPGSRQAFDSPLLGSVPTLHLTARPIRRRGAIAQGECYVSIKSMSVNKRIGLAAAGVVTIGGVVLGAASLANADPASPSPSASAGTTGEADGSGRGGPSTDAVVTGDELA